FNTGMPLVGKLLGWTASKLPGGQWLADRAKTLAEKGLERATAGLPKDAAPAAPALSPRELKIEKRVRLVPDNPSRQEAIRQLSDRLPDDKMMTPGSVTDEPGLW